MKKPRYTEQQIAEALRQVEQGTAATVVCRKLGVSETTFYHRARPLYRIWEKIPTMASRNVSYRRSTAFRRRRVRRPENIPGLSISPSVVRLSCKNQQTKEAICAT